MNNQLIALGVIEQGGRAVVASRNVARVFDKNHQHVMRDIRAIIEKDDDWNASNFGQIEYTDARNRKQPEFVMTRDGFVLLAMGFTGEKAMQFKKAYIAAFNEMEKNLAPRNYKQALLALITKEEEREALEAQNKVLQITADKYEGQTDTLELYKIGEIAAEFGITARKLNRFLQDCRIQYKPNGSNTWRLYSDYLDANIALPRIVTLDNGYEQPMLLWTPKGRDFIVDLAEREMPQWYV